MSKSSQINDRPGQEVKISTKAALGFTVGVKFFITYALLFAPYSSKEAALENGTSRTLEYIKACGRASILGCVLTTSAYGVQHHLYK